MTQNTEFSVTQTIQPIEHKIISILILIYFFSYGKGQNKADTFPKTGRKQQLV